MRLVVRALSAATALLLAACAARLPAPLPLAAEATPSPAEVTVAEAWTSPPLDTDELDSLAAWQDADGHLWLYATAKGSQRVVQFDATDGRRVRAIGGPGTAPGRFGRPNGIAAHGDLLFVVERDNHRVQVLALPELEPVATFGQDHLRTPYGLWVYEHAPGDLTILVTDSYMADFARSLPPPREQLAERIKQFRVRVDQDGLHADYIGAFGDTSDGALSMVESIAGDLAGERLLIADESHDTGPALREYALDGRYLGRSLPAFTGDPEGVVLWECEAGAGYWVAAEQVRPTRFHLYARHDLAEAGQFTGTRTAWTDGVAVFAAPSARFPGGVLFALDDDRSVAAFDLRDIARALQLSPHCAR